jgi:hypothetical protein
MFCRRAFRLTCHAGLAAAALLLAGCAADGNGKSLGETLQLTTRTAEAKDWVANTRSTGEPDYIPVGVTPPNRPSPAMAADQLASATAELDATRENATAFANRPAPASRVTSRDDVLAQQRARLAAAGNAPSRGDDQAALLAEQKRRLKAAGLLDNAQLPSEKQLREAADKSRAFARRPLPGAPTSVPAEQPTSWPVPENRRRNRQPTS